MLRSKNTPLPTSMDDADFLPTRQELDAIAGEGDALPGIALSTVSVEASLEEQHRGEMLKLNVELQAISEDSLASYWENAAAMVA